MFDRLFLGAAALLYAVFAVICTWRPRASARSIGFDLTTPSAVSEFAVVYGGLEIGLAAIFACTALRSDQVEAGLWFALLLHAPLVLWRVGSFAVLGRLSGFVYSVFALEVAITAIAAFLLVRRAG